MKNPMTTRSWIALFLTLVSVQFAWAVPQQPPGSKKLTFDQDPIGSPPSGFEFARTGQGSGLAEKSPREQRRTLHTAL